MYNPYQQMHFTALTSMQAPKKPKQYALFEGKNEVLRGEYSLLVYRKKQLTQNGHRFLTIKQIKTHATK